MTNRCSAFARSSSCFKGAASSIRSIPAIQASSISGGISLSLIHIYIAVLLRIIMGKSLLRYFVCEIFVSHKFDELTTISNLLVIMNNSSLPLTLPVISHNTCCSVFKVQALRSIPQYFHIKFWISLSGLSDHDEPRLASRFLKSLYLAFARLSFWWAQVDSNHRPRAYQARALTA